MIGMLAAGVLAFAIGYIVLGYAAWMVTDHVHQRIGRAMFRVGLPLTCALAVGAGFWVAP